MLAEFSARLKVDCCKSNVVIFAARQRVFVPSICKNLSHCACIAGRLPKQYILLSGWFMKQPITIRLDSELLATARMKAKEENRTLTNFLETALKERFDGPGISRASGQSSESQKPSKRNFKRSFVAKS